MGSTGEDYATPGYDVVSIQTSDPREVVYHALDLKRSQEAASRLRREARRTAERYTWPAVIQRALAPLLRELGLEISVPTPAVRHSARAAGFNKGEFLKLPVNGLKHKAPVEAAPE